MIKDFLKTSSNLGIATTLKKRQPVKRQIAKIKQTSDNSEGFKQKLNFGVRSLAVILVLGPFGMLATGLCNCGADNLRVVRYCELYSVARGFS